MIIYQHPNVEKTESGKVDVTSGNLTFFDPFLHPHFPNSLNQTFEPGTYEIILYKFREPSKSNGIIALEVIFENIDPVKWIDAEYTNDPQSDFHYTNSCGLLADPGVLTGLTIAELRSSIQAGIESNNQAGINLHQIELGAGHNCVYVESGLGWYDISVDLKWGFSKEGKVCRLLADFYSPLL